MFAVASRERLDVLVVSLGLAPSRTRAQALILAGKVIVDDHAVDKPGTRVSVDAEISPAELAGMIDTTIADEAEGDRLRCVAQSLHGEAAPYFAAVRRWIDRRGTVRRWTDLAA